MRVVWAWHISDNRPYRICVIGITIWSFLISAISSLDPPECPAQVISPRSRFCEAAQVEITKSGAVLCENDKLVSEEFKRDACLLQTHLITAKLIKYNYPIHILQQLLSRTTRGSIHVCKIPKNEGLYIKYREDKNSPSKIAHYFIKEENSHTGKYKLIKDDFEKPVYVEEITEAEFGELKKVIKVLFTPEGHCHRAIAEAIDSAGKTIDAAIFDFNNAEIVQALERAKARGVRVRMIGKRAPMHDKFMIIDREIVYSGSYNWTDKAESNRENVIVLPCAEPFLKEFEYMWGGEKDKLWPRRDTAPPERIGALFSPRDRCNECIKNIISQAINENPRHIPTKIQIALYFFTDNQIAEKLFEAKENGFDVEVLLDKTQESRKDSVVKKLFELQREADKKGLPSRGRGYLKIRYHRIEGVTMHNKFAVIGNTTITGSYNWTKPAWQKNNENLIIIPFIVEEYSDEFERLWSEPGAEIILDEGKHLRPPSTGPPDYIIQGSTTDGVEQYLKGDDAKEAENFKKGSYEMRVATEDLVLYRVFDNNKAYPIGRWLSKLDNVRGPPNAIINILKLFNLVNGEKEIFNYARYRLPVVIKKGTIFAHGAVTGGTGWQVYIPRAYLPERGSYENERVRFYIEKIKELSNSHP